MLTGIVWPVGLLLLGLVLLFFGGEYLVRGSSALALRWGMTPLVVGLTVVAFGTSAPELMVSVKAALSDQGAISIGNILGSNVLNIGLILGLTAMISPLKVRPEILRIDLPILVVSTVLVVGILADFQIGRIEGAFLVVGLAIYTIPRVVFATKEISSVGIDPEGREGLPVHQAGIWHSVAFVVGGLVLLVIGSRAMIEGAVTLARGFGVTEAVIGLTIVALGTSLPELSACVVAALKGKPDLALGNVIGSCIFNLLGILGVAAIVKPMVASGIVMADFLVAIAFVVVLWPLLFGGLALRRREGLLLVIAYAGYVFWLWTK